MDDNTITSHLKRILKKFLVVDETFDEIETVYGMGYRWRASLLGFARETSSVSCNLRAKLVAVALLLLLVPFVGFRFVQKWSSICAKGIAKCW